MTIISGCVIERDNKILMVKEAKKRCYGQWNFPAGHVNEFEKIADAAIREVFEETGCKVKLTGVLPIATKFAKEETQLHIRFTAEIIEEHIKFEESEILDVKWLDIEKLKNMSETELRGYDININFIKCFEKGKIYPLEVFENKTFIIDNIKI